ncbi:MAG: M48 family metallopeptidase [Armatimonadota bacterium]
MSTKVKCENMPNPPAILVYISLLFVPGVYILLLGCAAAMLGGTGFVCYWVFTWMTSGHRVPVKLLGIVILLMIGALMGCWAVVRGIAATIWSKPQFEPALIVPLNKEPELGKFIAGLCSAVGTGLPDYVMIHAEPTFYVCQSKIETLNGRAKGRILAIGLPLVAGLTINELRAILAHEFAHFSGGDTLYSSRVVPVYSGAVTACATMTECINESDSMSQALPMMAPRFLLDIYLRLFHLINMTISRTREKRADMISALTCGSQSFKIALMKTAGLMPTFWDESAKKIVMENNPDNCSYYTAFRSSLPKLTDLANAHYKHRLIEVENKYDSHPILQTRLESIPDIVERYTDKGSSSRLLINLEEYEQKLGEFYKIASAAPMHNT